MLNAKAFGLAFAAAAAIFWLLCSLLVYLLPRMMMDMTGDMVHADLTSMNWNMTLSGFGLGLLLWTIVSGLFGWVIAVCYNWLAKKTG